MRSIAKLLCVILTLIISVSTAESQKEAAKTRKSPPLASQSLSGIWHANDGGTYQVRQEGTKVWWFGQSPNNGRDWQNVFYGTITNDQLVGEWADLPGGTAQSSGMLQLQIQPGRITKLSETGGFGGSEWSGPNESGTRTRINDVGAVTKNIETSSKLPQEYHGDSKADGAISVPISSNVIEWFNSSAAPMLQGILQRLAGDEALRQYLNWESQQHPSDLQRVDLRLKAINEIIH